MGSSLPPCPQNNMAGWDLCGGTFIENRDIFRGELRNNQKNGFGKCTWNNRDLYKGNWEKGKLSSNVIFSYSGRSYFYDKFDNGAKISLGLKLAPHSYAELCEHHPSEIKNFLNSDLQGSFPVLKDVFNAYPGDNGRGIQLKLKKAGFYHIPADGILGRDSLIAIMKYASDTLGNNKLNNPDLQKHFCLH